MASAGGSAFSGIEAVKEQPYGKSARVMEIRGERGEPQPKEWALLLSDPKARGGVREVAVAEGKITSERTPLRATSDITALTPLDTKGLAFDSDNVFQTVQAEAAKKEIGFHWIDYVLRTDPQTGTPTWHVKLHDYMGAPVATIQISATRGAILSPLQKSPEVHAEPTPKEKAMGGLLGDVSKAAGRAVKSTKESSLRFIGNIQEELVGERTIGPKEEE